MYFRENPSEKYSLRKEYYYYYYYYYYYDDDDDDDDERYKKMPFLSISVHQLFACWLSLGSYSGL